MAFLGCYDSGADVPPTPDGFRGPKAGRPPKQSSLIDAGQSLNAHPRKTCAIIEDSSVTSDLIEVAMAAIAAAQICPVFTGSVHGIQLRLCRSLVLHSSPM